MRTIITEKIAKEDSEFIVNLLLETNRFNIDIYKTNKYLIGSIKSYKYYSPEKDYQKKPLIKVKKLYSLYKFGYQEKDKQFELYCSSYGVVNKQDYHFYINFLKRKDEFTFHYIKLFLNNKEMWKEIERDIKKIK